MLTAEPVIPGADTHIPSPDGQATPPDGYPSWDTYMADFETLVGERADWDLSRRITKAMRLAPDLLTFEALMAGQEVPVEALDRRWRRRYGL